jgi:tetratricopeptide (TPR) repeat protein
VAIATGDEVFVAPVPRRISGGTAEVRRWAEARAGWTLEAAGTVARLQPAEWARRRREFAAEGGEAAMTGSPPADDRERHYNIALTCWLDNEYDAAIWHLDRLLASAPGEQAPWLVRAGAHVRLGHTEFALRDLERVLALGPRGPAEWLSIFDDLRMLPKDQPLVQEFELRALVRGVAAEGAFYDLSGPLLSEMAARAGARGRWDFVRSILNRFKYQYFGLVEKRIIASLMFGDLAAYRGAIKPYFDAGSPDKRLEPGVTWLMILRECVLAPDAVGDPEALVRVAEAKRDADRTPKNRADLTRIVGAALYRAGRYSESIASIEEGLRISQGPGDVRDWAFLAMAHARLGHGPEARSWLDRLASFQAPEGPDRFWEEQRALILRREAEAVVLYDPAFPADPFAPE